MRVEVVRRATAALSAGERAELQALVVAAFDGGDRSRSAVGEASVAAGAGLVDDDERFSQDDWDHALGGIHVIALLDDVPVCHAAVVPRTLHTWPPDSRAHAMGPGADHAARDRRGRSAPEPTGPAARQWRAGYVEAVGTLPAYDGQGIGSQVMAHVNDVVRAGYELGGLGTGRHSFYERLGWERWQGTTWVVQPDGSRRRSAEDDDGVMVLRCGPSASLDLRDALACEARAGDDW